MPRIGSEAWIEYHVNAKNWRTSSIGTVWKNICHHNVAIIQEPNEPRRWSFRIKDPGGSEEWDREKYRISEEAKRPALEKLAAML